ncbi:putative ZIP zinc transporter [Geopyxis carbonaria]|nr:putative ZIP zinc transporter [Geopyxis carbonaria]
MLAKHCQACLWALFCFGSLVAESQAQSITALGDCHVHDGGVQYCQPLPTGEEVAVTTATATAAQQALPTAYSDCHGHDGEIFCVNDKGEDVGPIKVSTHTSETHSDEETAEEHAAHSDEETAEEHAAHSDEETAEEHAAHADEAEAAPAAAEKCHFHAGVEHCGPDTSSAATLTSCQRTARKYNLPLRIGSIFIVLATSTIAVGLPLLLSRFRRTSTWWLTTAIRQFGTGVIVATAFVHLLTHAALMFDNPCVGPLRYEATTTAIAMAGLVAAWAVEAIGERFVDARRTTRNNSISSSSIEKPLDAATASDSECGPACSPACDAAASDAAADTLSVAVMEAGIIFHSVLIGLTLVVAGDSVFTTLLIVIIFHQGFEGLALSSRIVALPAKLSTKLIMAAAFAVITPLGMAIGVAVRNSFNGRDRDTLIALGTLDAISAGVLVWVGCVEMWARDWEALRREPVRRALWAAFWLLSGMLVMGILGKWA